MWQDRGRRRRRPGRPAVLTKLVVLLATVAVGTAGCAREPGADPTPTVSARGSASPAGAAPAAPAEPVTPMAPSRPVRVRIPAIGVDSRLMPLGLQQDGTLQVPPAGFPAGWYTGAPTPGELGPAVIVGHVRYGEQKGVFRLLRLLQADDEVTVRRADGSTAVFRVTRVVHLPKDDFPTQMVYGNIHHAGLRLITCGGLDRQAQRFNENVIAFARLVGARQD